MGPFVAAWLVAEVILIFTHYRASRSYVPGPSGANQPSYAKVPPIGPTTLVIASGPFVLLALLAEAPQARSLATLIAWGVDIAAFLALTSGKVGWLGSTGGWPPPIAPNNTIFPTGVVAKQNTTPASAATNPSSTTLPATA